MSQEKLHHSGRHFKGNPVFTATNTESTVAALFVFVTLMKEILVESYSENSVSVLFNLMSLPEGF